MGNCCTPREETLAMRDDIATVKTTAAETNHLAKKTNHLVAKIAAHLNVNGEDAKLSEEERREN